ncbi:hypothetical protein BKA70DRAFT_1357558 [Coprinopsis sp. MPI-PUGE-AT-0042]|nr:hypothetical protein BKA70DRAFT_1357558 [Coprinopsis sp. MPI-PUGE-AT-0042]
MDVEHSDTENEPQDRHWGWMAGYLMIFSVITLGCAGWLADRYRGGDEPPHPVMVPMCWYIIAISIYSLFFFFGLAGVYAEKKISGMGLWMTLVSWCMWVAASVGITAVYKGSYDCYASKHPFPHCNQLVALQAFCWIMMVWTTMAPISREDKLRKELLVTPNTIQENDQQRPQALEDGRGDIEMGEIQRDARVETNEEQSHVGPPDVSRKEGRSMNLGSIPGPPEPKPHTA